MPTDAILAQQMPAFHLLEAIRSIGQLDPFVLIAWPLLFVLVLTLSWRAHAKNRRERDEEAAAERLAAFVRCQRDAQLFRALKGGQRGAR